MKNYQKSLGYPVCELPDYDFNESFDINYLRCQYDARAIVLINRAEESIVEHRYGAIDEARDREATRILSQPRPWRRRAYPTYPPEPILPPPGYRQEVRIQEPTHPPPGYRQEVRIQEPAHPPPAQSQARQIQLLERINDIILQHIIRLSQTQVVAPTPKMSVILKLDTPTEGVASCGICMSDEIPLANMVKTGCNHEYCDACISQIVSKNPCCAFCRGNITELCVNSHVVYNKLNV